MTNPLLNYYLDQGISPVRYRTDSLQQHLERRAALYDNLGLPRLAFKSARVLEIAAGSGQNSLYPASAKPSELTLIEPNPAGIRQIQETYRTAPAEFAIPVIVQDTFENFAATQNRFDVVLCENWLGSTPGEMENIHRLFALLQDRGVLVLTTVAPAGWLPNLIRYILARRLTDYRPQASREEKLDALTKAFSPHLATMPDMTRSHADWVADNVASPAYLSRGLTLHHIIERLPRDGFNILGSSPRFITDWRWFKAVHGPAVTCTEPAMQAYAASAVSALDYRHPPQPCTVAIGRQLESLAVGLVAWLQEHATIDFSNPEHLQPLQATLHAIRSLIGPLRPEWLDALEEVENRLRHPVLDDPGHIANMPAFSGWFGRETQYFSFQRIDHP